MKFNGFISYSHAADGRLAPAVQRGLHHLAKPWHRRRALWIFRDQTGLSVTPTLWTSIQNALDGSDYFVLMASPEAANSHWVNREIDHWLATKSPDRILPVVTDGDWQWDPATGDFTESSTAVPEALRGVFTEEPLYLDLRWARDDQQLSLRHSRFRDAIAQLAAPMHGVSKDDLEGEDVRQHRRARRLWSFAAASLMLLTFVSVLTGLLALHNADRANASAAEARRQQQAASEQRGYAEQSAAESLRQQKNAQQQEARARAAAEEVRRQEALAREQKTLAAKASTAAEKQQANARYQRALADTAAARARQQEILAQQQRNAAEQAAAETRRQEERARLQETRAREQEQRAEEAAQNARRQERIAAEHERKAKEAEGEARRQQHIAISRRLVNQAKANIDAEPQAALRLGLAAERIRADAETRGGLAGLVASTHYAGALGGAHEVAYGPDGLLALAEPSGTVSLWDVRNRATPIRLSTLGASRYVGRLTFSPDGRTLTLVEPANVGALWDVSDRAQPTRIATLPHAVNNLMFSPDGRTVVSTGYDGRTVLWDASNRAQPKLLTALSGIPASARIAFNGDGRAMVTSGDPSVVWDLSDPAHPTPTATLPEALPDGMAFNPKRPILAAGGRNGTVHIWDLTDPAYPRQEVLTGHAEWAAGLAFHPDGSILAVSDGEKVTLWNTAGSSGSLRLQTLDRVRGGAASLEFSPDGRTLATVNGAETKLWNVADRGAPEPVADLVAHRRPVMTMAYRAGGKTLATVDADGKAVFWDMRRVGNPAPSATLQFSGGDVNAALTADGRTLAVASLAHGVTLTDVTDPHDPVTLGSFQEWVPRTTTMMFSPDGRTIAILAHRTLKLWDVSDPRHPVKLGVLTGDAVQGRQLAFSPDSRTIAVVAYNTVTLIDVTDRAAPVRVAEVPAQSTQALSVAFSPDGNTLATGGYDRTAVLWNVTDRARPHRLATLVNPTGWVGSLAFGPDGRTLAAGIADRTVMLWDITDGATPVRFTATKRTEAQTGMMLFSPDGRTFTVGSDLNRKSPAVTVWDYSELNDLRADPVAHACAIAGNGLSPDEWARHIPELPYRRSCDG
ncbi:TIR domain-containing protein [Spirilliplanes yamanashiensis]|uniref:TIR domain-containing protein n=1 Tax=Spirilliplanes yamanashiensis TaxID=42233 RepID=A0A8J4DJ00_9ACTN|nr:TIR domain-containing protein [Spirilliplanes yamanashiensis]MDP9815387.1 WD40 repeat protein [Spirilliplanes yamanashiensis]GIJ03642.1 hypothetical protein Sya03_29940 [Spirilliplanes yamanashiensis]